MINYHSGMRMMVFYSPQVIFYQIPSPCSSLSRPHCHGDPITPKGSSELCGIWVKLHGVLADSKPYGCQVWKFIRTAINNNQKLLLSLKSWVREIAEGERVPAAFRMKWSDLNCHEPSTAVPYVKHMYSYCSELLKLLLKYQSLDTTI